MRLKQLSCSSLLELEFFSTSCESSYLFLDYSHINLTIVSAINVCEKKQMNRMGCQLNGLPGGHGHSHGGHKNPDEVALLDDMENGPNKKEKNINVRAAFIHVLGDLIHSVGVFCAAIVVYFKPEWSFVDPICTFFFSILVLSTTSVILRDVLNVFMEGAPRNIDFLKVQKCLATIPGVVTVHNLRIWALSLDKVAMSAHIAIDQGFNPIEVIETASRTVQSRFDIFESTIQVEEYRSDMDHCLQCKSL